MILVGTTSEWRSIGRAVGGAVIFSLPLMMTMEMWWLAYYIPPTRLMCLLALSLPLFFGVSRVIGFTEKRDTLDNVMDVFVAYAFGFVISAVTLFLFNTISVDLAPDINLAAITLQAIPATLGALLGRSEVGSGEHNPQKFKRIGDQIVVLAVGALFLGLNVAPTEEIVLIARQMTDWQRLGLFVTTLLIMVTFAVGCSFIDRDKFDSTRELVYSHVHFCGATFLISLVVSLFLLWVFGHFETGAPAELLAIVIVLLFPTGIGAAAAKIIV